MTLVAAPRPMSHRNVTTGAGSPLSWQSRRVVFGSIASVEAEEDLFTTSAGAPRPDDIPF
jgi:hypothetical protein